jgi:quinol monooxygenase YgiN
MNQPCIVLACFTPLPGKLEEVLEVLKGITPVVHQEEGCELYALHTEVEGKVFFIEKWTTRALWKQHSGAESVATLRAGLTNLLAQDAEVWEMYGEDIGHKGKAAL